MNTTSASETTAAPRHRPAASETLRRSATESLAPTVVSWQKKLLGPLHVTGVFWYRLHAWAMSWLPKWLLPPLMVVFAGSFWLFLYGMRRAISNNLEWVFGHRLSLWQRLGASRRTLFNHAWCLTETYEGLLDRHRTEVETVGVEHWRQLTTGDRGFVLVTAHVGHWEVGSRIEDPEKSRKIHVVREPEINPRAQQFVEEIFDRQAGDDLAVHFTRSDDPALGARLLVALRRGEVVALQGDRPRSGGRSARVQLFGQPLDLPIGPVALARAARVPVLPVFVFRAGRLRSRIVFRQPITVARTADRAADCHRALQEIVSHIEWAIRQEPNQWFCFKDLWGRPPAGS